MRAKSSPGIMILLVLVGAVLGSLLWSLATPYLPPLFARAVTVGTPSAPFVLDLGVMTLTLGVVLQVNVGSMLGIVAGVLIFRKL